MQVKILSTEAKIPAFAHPGDAGLDLCSIDEVTIFPGEKRRVHTGIAIAIPDGYVGLMFPRSGSGSNGMALANTVGVIDSGYRGEIIANLKNNGAEPMHIHKGDRVVQLVTVPCLRYEPDVVDVLPPSERGDGGFGSTGR